MEAALTQVARPLPHHGQKGEHRCRFMLENTGGTEAALSLESLEPMRIEVIGEDESSTAQARAYAEYRVFAALARHTPRVRGPV